MTADCISAIASCATAVIAGWALCVAKQQIGESRKIAREATATNLYNHCLEMSLQYPKLAEPALSGGFEKLTSDPEVAAKYGYYAASMLLSCEEILSVTNNDDKWRKSVMATLDGHTDYFRYRKTDRPLISYYNDELVAVIDELMNNSDNPPVPQAIRLSESKDA